MTKTNNAPAMLREPAEMRFAAELQALAQAEAFTKVAGVTGLIMTKLDGTARGGILVAIAEKFKLPIHAVGVGETIDDLQPFDAEAFSRAIAGLEEAA